MKYLVAKNTISDKNYFVAKEQSLATNYFVAKEQSWATQYFVAKEQSLAMKYFVAKEYYSCYFRSPLLRQKHVVVKKSFSDETIFVAKRILQRLKVSSQKRIKATNPLSSLNIHLVTKHIVAKESSVVANYILSATKYCIAKDWPFVAKNQRANNSFAALFFGDEKRYSSQYVIFSDDNFIAKTHN